MDQPPEQDPRPSPAAETPEADKPPYVIEGARSSRAKCKTCRRAITKGTLRIGILIVGPFGPGYLWHHLTCAARRQPDRVAEAYAAKAWQHAKEPPAKLPDLEQLAKLREAAVERKRVQKQIPWAEIAPSGRSKCQHCAQPIDQGTPRVMLGREVQFGNQVRTAPIKVHPRCVREALDAEDCANEPEGFFDELRANSADFDPSKLDALVAEIGALE